MKSFFFSSCLLLACSGAAQAQAPATFAPLATYPTGGSISLRVVTGDLDGDGRVDAVTANITSNNVSVFLNTGNGSFAPAVRYAVAPAGVQAQGVTLGDVNADGRLDIVTANNGNSTVGVLLAQAGGGFSPVDTYSTGANTEPRNAALGDVNGDGRLDIVTGNSVTATASVLLGQANGSFAAPVQYPTAGANFDVALGDVTADGRLDIVTPNYSTNTVSVLPGQAGGTFGAFTRYSTGANSQSVGIRLGDVDLDGRLDVVASNQNSTVSVLLGQAGGTLAASANYSTGAITTSYAVGIGDVNGDGRPDLVSGNLTGSLIGVLLGQAGGFGPVTTYASGNGSQGLTLTDVNADRKIDVLVANRGDNTLGVLVNTGTATTLPVELTAFTAEARGAAALLRWTTAQEVNNDYFAVESSVDGQRFHPLGRVRGHGNTTGRHDYQFTAPLGMLGAADRVYYRLRQVDTDGTATLSPVRVLAVRAGAAVATLRLVPNPARDQVQVLGAVGPVEVLDMTGRVVRQGGSSALVVLAELPAGIYVVRNGTRTAHLVVE